MSIIQLSASRTPRRRCAGGDCTARKTLVRVPRLRMQNLSTGLSCLGCSDPRGARSDASCHSPGLVLDRAPLDDRDFSRPRITRCCRLECAASPLQASRMLVRLSGPRRIRPGRRIRYRYCRFDASLGHRRQPAANNILRRAWPSDPRPTSIFHVSRRRAQPVDAALLASGDRRRS